MERKLPRVRIMKIQKPTYSIENPNPEWKIKGEKWITFALSKSKCDVGEVYNVAYIPHIPIEIRQSIQVHNLIPTRWDLEVNSKASNFDMGGGNNKFRLNARYNPQGTMFIKSRKNVDLSPIEDKESILELLKLAEKIYDPPE